MLISRMACENSQPGTLHLTLDDQQAPTRWRGGSSRMSPVPARHGVYVGYPILRRRVLPKANADVHVAQQQPSAPTFDQVGSPLFGAPAGP